MSHIHDERTPARFRTPVKEPALSSVPSEAIYQALRDLEALERDEKYKIDMNDWHYPENSSKAPCHVCLAGAVIARAGNDPRQIIMPSNFANEQIENRLMALDKFRFGSIKEGLEEWFAQSRNDFRNVETFDSTKITKICQAIQAAGHSPNFVFVESYQKSPTKFKTDLRIVATILEQAGS